MMSKINGSVAAFQGTVSGGYLCSAPAPEPSGVTEGEYSSATLTVDETGTVTDARSGPKPCMLVSQNAPITIPNATWTQLSFNTAVINPDGLWNGSEIDLNGPTIAPGTDTWEFSYRINWQVSAVGIRGIRLRSSFFNVVAHQHFERASVGFVNSTLVGSGEMTGFGNGSQIFIDVYQNSGGNLNIVTPFLYVNPNQFTFSLKRNNP